MFQKLSRRSAALVTTMALFAVLCVVGVVASPEASAADPCGVGGNAIACENTKAGVPASQWDTPNPSTTIEGFATDTSVNAGSTISFKVKTPSTGYRLDIYRIGYYGGNGARLITSVNPSASLPQNQPACITQTSTGLIDCGNWGVSASWAVPSTAVSGVYEAKLVRTDSPGLNNQIMFVVRNDASHSDLIFQTSDTTWQAYNSWGGNSLYTGNPAGRAYKVSFNRPYNTRANASGEDFFFSTEYPMVRFLEANGYDVSYQSGLDTDRSGARLLNHKTFLSVGHDEYWSGAQRTNVETARDAGVNLSFFSGNIALWKIRYEASIDGANSAYRTLVSYKETKAAAKIDPSSTWTGSWRDPRFSPPSDGGRPENAMTGTLWMVQGTNQAMTVPAEDGKLRLWRNTSLANLAAGTSGTLPRGVLGYEYDVDADNGFRPAGLFHLSTSTNSETEIADDYGATVGPGTATHNLTEYRAPSGAIVFSAATVQWNMGLDANHDANLLGAAWNQPGPTVSTDMQQATVNILADQGAQPVTLISGLTLATKSTDTVAPTSTITSPAPGATVPNGAVTTVTGTASDVGGRVGGVEVSLDGGSTWHPATGRGNWSYTGSFTGTGATSVRVRATDDSGNIQTTSTQVGVTVACPCSIFGLTQSPPGQPDADDHQISVGVKFTSDVSGWITGVRFYKTAENTGTHIGSLWSAGGTRLATMTFTGETASGWQQANFSTPVAVTAGTTYVVSYYAPNGRYASTTGYFSQTGTPTGPLRAPSSASSGGNGVYGYGVDVFPGNQYGAANYWVDAVLSTSTGPTAPAVIARTPAAGATGVPTTTAVTATFDQSVQPASAVVSVTGPGNVVVAGSTAYVDATRTVTFTPSAALVGNTPYSVSVTATSTGGLAMGSPAQWSFTTAAVPGACPCTLFSSSSVPTVPSVNDNNSVEVGMRFSADRSGLISGVRFYKGASNVGTHVGTLWSSTGTQLARATFSGESASGWQQVSFASPVAVTAGTTYVVSYHTAGFYSANQGQFSGSGVDNAPLHAPADGSGGANGLYAYGASPVFPTATYGSSNYWVDVVFNDGTDTTKPTVTSTVPAAGATGVATSSTVRAVMSERLQTTSSTITLTGPSGTVAGTTTYNDPTTTVTFTPTAALAAGVTYTATLSGSTDLAGNVIAAPVTWSFTTAAADTTKPTVTSTVPAAGATGVATSSTVRAVMSERLQTTSSTITLTGPSGTVAGATAYSDPTTTVTFTPTAALATSATYTATLSGSTDLAGNVIAAPVSWSFTTAAAPSSVTMFNTSDVPAVTSAGDTGNVELGVRFSPDVNGTVTGVRFYKGTGNTGTHTGTLWSSTGTQLATGTFSGESATGWQTLTFTTPVTVTAGQVYTASYHAPVGGYAYTSAYFGSQLDRAPLHAMASSDGGNGVYLYGARAFPSSTYNATNYWVDAVFVPAPSGAAVSGAAISSAAAPATSLLTAYGVSDLGVVAEPVTRFLRPFFLSRFAR